MHSIAECRVLRTTAGGSLATALNGKVTSFSQLQGGGGGSFANAPKNPTSSPHTVFMCFICFSEQNSDCFPT
jgi:hypothetical protein